MRTMLSRVEFEHAGVAVRNVEESLGVLGKFFELQPSEVYEDPLQNVKILFVTLAGMKVELIAPLDTTKKSPVDGFLKKGVSYYHLCFRTDSLEETVSEFVREGAVVVLDPIPAKAYGDAKIAFLFVEPLGLIELVETSNRRKT